MCQLCLSVPDDCIFEIFKYIKKNCESERPDADEEIQYADLISFVASCERILNLLHDWNANLYERLEYYVALQSKRIHIDLEEKYIRLKDASAKDKDAYWSSLSHAIRDSDLTEVILSYAPKSFHPEHMEAFHTVMAQLQKKLNLKKLEIISEGYSLEGLGRLESLEILYLNIRMDIDDLVEICRQNKDLRVLSYENNETGGKRLAAIAPHCHQLEKLTFRMRADCDASEYTPLATIPRLEDLRILGVHEKGTLHPLLDGLASNQQKVLIILKIDDVLVDENEAQAIAQIETLSWVTCGFDDPQSIGLLAQLPNLEDLDIRSRHDLKAICEQLLSILKESKTDKTIFLVNSYLTYRPSGELAIKMSDYVNASDYSPLSTLPGLSSLRIKGSPQTGSLQGLLAALASSQTQTLQEFSLQKGDIQPGEAKELVRLRYLRVLKCRFADPEDIQLLSQLTDLIELDLRANKTLPGILTAIKKLQKSCKKLAKINIRCSYPVGPVDIKSSEILVEMLEACQDEIYISVNGYYISINRGKKLLSVHMDFLNQNNLLALFLPLLEPVNHMEINGPRKDGSLRKFLANLATRKRHDLQSLSIPGNSLDFSETTELAKITSLKSFRGRIYDIRSIQHLLHLNDFIVMDKDTGSRYKFDKGTGKLHFSRSPRYSKPDFPNATDLSCIANLQNLRHVSIRGSFKWGNMHSFFEKLATYQGGTLEELRVSKRYEFNDADLREVIRMKSLRTLACDLSSVEDVEIEQLAQLPQLAVLIVESHLTGSLRNLLGNLASKEFPTLERLAVRGGRLTPQEVTEVSAISSLKRLECNTDGLDDQGIVGLSEALHLEELTISPGRERGSLKGLFRALSLRAPPNFKSLFLLNICIDHEEARLLVQVDSITRLSCGFKDEESFSLLPKMTNLESLQITSKHELTNISRQLLDIFRGCRKLESIDLGRTYDIRHEFLTDALDTLKSVRDPSTQCPLKIWIDSDELNDMLIDIDETYLIVHNNLAKPTEHDSEDESMGERGEKSSEESEEDILNEYGEEFWEEREDESEEESEEKNGGESGDENEDNQNIDHSEDCLYN